MTDGFDAAHRVAHAFGQRLPSPLADRRQAGHATAQPAGLLEVALQPVGFRLQRRDTPEIVILESPLGSA
jgi:hypothetical protein